jgi:hypothetical protein
MILTWIFSTVCIVELLCCCGKNRITFHILKQDILVDSCDLKLTDNLIDDLIDDLDDSICDQNNVAFNCPDLIPQPQSQKCKCTVSNTNATNVV